MLLGMVSSTLMRGEGGAAQAQVASVDATRENRMVVVAKNILTCTEDEVGVVKRKLYNIGERY